MAIMEGTSPKDKLESTYTQALKKNWMVWPWVQAINFKLVPLEHRVLVVNVVSLGESYVRSGESVAYLCEIMGRMADADLGIGWNCYLSYINSQSK